MKNFKKILCIFLAAVMITAPVTVFAASNHPASDNYPYTLEDMKIIFDEKDENGNYYPLIVVPGISQSTMYVVDENYDYESAEDPTYPPIKHDAWGNELTGELLIFDIAATVKAAVKYLIVPLICSVIFQKDCGFVNAIEKVADVAFSPQQTFPDGTSKNKTDTIYFDGSFADYATPEGAEETTYMQDRCNYLYKIIPLNPVKEVIGDENLFFFEFNLFSDPMSTADKLDEYIDMVLERTGASKVNLLPISLGGTIFTAFAEKFTNTDKVNAVVTMVAALNGTQVMTDMFNRDFIVDPEFWYTQVFPLAISQYENFLPMVSHLINIAFHTLPWDVNAAMISKLYDVMFDHLMVNTPQFWAMVRREAYPELAEKFLGEDRAAVREKTDEFYRAQMNIEKNIQTMRDNGVEINLVAGYNLLTGERRYEFMQIMGQSANTNGDGVLNIESTTLGATAVLPGEQLPDSYTQAIDSDYCYISPDRELDASTGVLPDNTWYFYDMHHEDAANNAPVINLALALFYSSEVSDVHSNPEKFPQFNGNSDNWFVRRWRYNDIKRLYADYEAGEVEMTPEDVEELESLLYDCERMIRATVADMEFTNETTKRVHTLLNKYDRFDKLSVNRTVATDNAELSTPMKILDFVITTADKIIYSIFGPHGFSEFWKFRLGLLK